VQTRAICGWRFKMLEIIIETLEDALAAQAGGATQLDFKSALPIGGLTPSAGMIEQVCKSVEIDALIMIRPHARSFTFSNAEVAVMCGDIVQGRKLGAAGFLSGCLTEEGQVDVEAVKALQEAAGDLPLHFHLAWELTPDPSQALETLVRLGIRSVRVSGGGLGGKAIDGMAMIRQFAQQAAGRIELVLAGGVNAENVAQLVQGTGVTNVHVGTAARTPPTQYGAVDEGKVRELCEALSQATAAEQSGTNE
jgi:copper homeostasis protein